MHKIAIDQKFVAWKRCILSLISYALIRYHFGEIENLFSDTMIMILISVQESSCQILLVYISIISSSFIDHFLGRIYSEKRCASF